MNFISTLLENRVQLIAVAGSLFMLIFIVELIRRKKMKEEYSILWLFSGAVFLVLSVWRDALDEFAHLVGVNYPPASLLLVLVMGAFLIMVHYSIVITKISEKNKNLVQEISLLRHEVEKMNESATNIETSDS